MATAIINGARLFYELNGTAEVPLVLVHGSLDSHHTWDFVVPRLAESFRVLSYDRRGYGQSERLSGQGGVRQDIADLAGLIDHLGFAPAWLAGQSSGASIAFRLACQRPELLRGLIGHEPSLLTLLVDDPTSAPMLEQVMQTIRAVFERIASGDHAGAAKQILDTCLLYTSPSPRDGLLSRMPSSA